MSEAPERIWADGKDYWANPTFKDDKIEYVRADMLHEIFLRYSKTETARTKKLDLQLAKAVEALSEIATDEHPLGWIAIATLAELKGEKDEV
jgi:hypothetical protein